MCNSMITVLAARVGAASCEPLPWYASFTLRAVMDASAADLAPRPGSRSNAANGGSGTVETNVGVLHKTIPRRRHRSGPVWVQLAPEEPPHLLLPHGHREQQSNSLTLGRLKQCQQEFGTLI